MSYQSKFADELRRKMAEDRISQATLSRLTGFNSGTISRVLSGKKPVSYETVCIIASKLNMWNHRTPCDLVKQIEYLEFKLSSEKCQCAKLTLLNIIFLISFLGVVLWK